MGQATQRTGAALRAVIRQLAGLLAFVFAFMAVVASVHHHPMGKVVRHSSVVAATVSGSIDLSDDLSPQLAYRSVDCILCDWMATVAHPIAPVAVLTLSVLTSVAMLLLSIRCAALCAAPTPRRGLRAPPVFSLAL